MSGLKKTGNMALCAGGDVPLPKIVVAAGIVWRQKRFLAASRPEHTSWAGYWEFPGGKVEDGESIEQALCRELEEELGITCSALLPWRTLLHAYSELLVELHVIHITAFAGEPRPKEGQELRWVTPEEARLMRFLPADVEVLPDIERP